MKLLNMKANARVMLLLSLLLALTMPVAAFSAQGEEPGPEDVLREGVGKLISFMSKPKRPLLAETARFLETEIAPYFDFDYMSGWVAGHSYRRMDDRQQAAATQQLKEQFLDALAQKLTGYQEQKVRIMRPRQTRRNEVTVDVGILQPGGYPSKLSFRFYHSDGGWKIFDVSANGSSALVYYRKQFRRQQMQQRQNYGARPGY